MSLRLYLLADNSSGEQTLHIDCGEDGLHLTLTGKCQEEDIQIDFDPLGKPDLDLLIRVLTSYKERL